MRGEYRHDVTKISSKWELPPRARRIRTRAATGADETGTTSACAENTPIAFQIKPRLWNYLHVRGEYCRGRVARVSRRELPPRARRIQLVEFFLRRLGGTTSACAENTFAFGINLHGCGNYLRVRGEYPAGYQRV